MQQIPKVRPGEALRADHINQLIEAVNTGLDIRGGAGINVSDDGGRVVIALAKLMGEYVKPARIVSHTGADIDEARNIAYTVREFESDNMIVNVRPSWGRPTRRDDVEIYAARVGSLCWIVREPMPQGRTLAKLWIPAGGSDGETLAFFECDSGAPLAVAGAVRGSGGGAANQGGTGLPPVDGGPVDVPGGPGSAPGGGGIS